MGGQRLAPGSEKFLEGKGPAPDIQQLTQRGIVMGQRLVERVLLIGGQVAIG